MLQLNYKKQGHGEPVILIHGLFGNLDNLGLLARPLSEQFEVISIDVRNHGLSPRAPAMDYPAMAGDVLALLDTLGLDNVMLVGHSMGGKIAMQLAKMAPARVRRLVVLDMAPVAYPPLRHHDVFAGLQAVEAAH
ncbi:MAG: alpha/beta fold hydrolase, partial [Aeromonas sp.]